MSVPVSHNDVLSVVMRMYALAIPVRLLVLLCPSAHFLKQSIAPVFFTTTNQKRLHGFFYSIYLGVSRTEYILPGEYRFITTN